MSSDAMAGSPDRETDTEPALVHLWRRAKRGWPERFPLVQFPNAPLIVAGGGWVVAAITEGSVHDYAGATCFTGLAAWAWLELADGANVPRRVLGAAGLVYVVVKVGDALGG